MAEEVRKRAANKIPGEWSILFRKSVFVRFTRRLLKSNRIPLKFTGLSLIHLTRLVLQCVSLGRTLPLGCPAEHVQDAVIGVRVHADT